MASSEKRVSTPSIIGRNPVKLIATMKKTPLIWLACVGLALGFSTTTLAAQDDVVFDGTRDAQDRLRVGLVLGGGGARGGAHIGVLKELEALRIPVDAITGTSMGAIIGGLYASGVTTDELEDIVATMDWSRGLSNQPNREDLSFRRREDDAEFPVGVELGFRDGRLQAPQGAVQGHHLDLILRDLTRHVDQVDNFDDLPIPFRAIASDVGSGDMYVMGSGDLALAIRASMSVPAAFDPVMIDDRLLVDGGLVGNLPVSVIQDMDVDVVIAVNVEFPLYPKEQLDSVLTITEQMFTILIRTETLRQIENLGEDDVLIEPDIGLFASTDFGNIADTIEPGAIATREQSDKLDRLTMTEEAYAAWQLGRAKPDPIGGDLAFVRVTNDSRISDDTLLSMLTVQPGDNIDTRVLTYEADRLFGLQLFEKVGYKLVDEGDGVGVEFTATEKTWGPTYLRFGVSLQDNIEGDTRFNVRSRITRPAINRFGGEWRSDLQLGTDPRLFTELYQPMSETSRLFVSPALEFRTENFNAFVDGDAVSRLRLSEFTASFDVGTRVSDFAEFRVGLYRGDGEADIKIGATGLEIPDFQSGGLRASLRFDTADDPFWPRHGVLGELRYQAARESLGDDADVDTASARFDIARSRGKDTIVLGGAYATTLDGDGGPTDNFTLGGLLRLSGLEQGQVSGKHLALLRAIYYRRVSEAAGGLFEMPVYIGASLEAGNTWQDRDDIKFDNALINGSLFGGLDTFIGPLYLAVALGEGGETSFYLSVGSLPF